jgi:uncharacterized NAD-dependent epimerase/dehydratase family protein
LPEPWRQEVKQAVAAGMSVMNGLHTSMADDPEFQALLKSNQWIWDVRREPANLAIGSGKARSLSCRRVLAVGTDMSVGKMSTGLELNRLSRQRGMRSCFLATGQTGLMLGYDGIPLDAIRIDFAAGAVEQIVMRHGTDHEIVYVEGQGSLLNPGSTATLPLLRGTQPTHLILVHRAGQQYIHNVPDVPIPPLENVVRLYETVAHAGGSFAPVKVVGIALNTFQLSESEAKQAIDRATSATGLPCTDPIRFGADLLLDAILV